MAQPIDAVALHQAHRAGVIVWPHRLCAMQPCRRDECRRDAIQCFVPANGAELAGALAVKPFAPRFAAGASAIRISSLTRFRSLPAAGFLEEFI